MLNIESLKKIDSEGMHEIYDIWPKIASDSYNTDLEITEFKDIDHIVFAGMGGSGSLGDVFSSILSNTNLHVSVVKGYRLPKTVDSNSLVISSSVSGNTRETLSILNTAKNLDCKLIAFSSGGKMEEFCFKNKIEFRKIPQNHSPRASFTGFLFSMLKILGNTLQIKKEDVNHSIEQLHIQKQQISSENLTKDNPALCLANSMSEIPLIYYPWGLQSAAIRFKNSLQENAKAHVIVEDVIEAGHNGIVSWEKKSNIKPILLQGKDDNLKTKERWEILKTYFQEKQIEYNEVHSIEGSVLSKLVYLIYFFDYTSIYRAILLNLDPSPVSSIDYIKKHLND